MSYDRTPQQTNKQRLQLYIDVYVLYCIFNFFQFKYTF